MSETDTLTRADLAEAVHGRIGLSRGESARVVERVLVHMCEALSRGENVKISGFGSFVLRDKGERIGRNPKTGIEVPIAPRRVLTFRASQMMRDAIVAGPAAADRAVTGVKADTAFRTISEVAQETGVAQHVLRYWETRFPQLRPLQRAGNRRYYRPADVALVRRIDALLKQQGYTVKGVQKLLAENVTETPAPMAVAQAEVPDAPVERDGAMLAELRAIRDALADALREDRAAD